MSPTVHDAGGRNTGLRFSLAMGAAIVLAIGLTYGASLGDDLLFDDYLARPRSWAELFAVWHGSWDPITHFFPVFYRPLAIWTDQASFFVFGLNAPLLHLLALGELALAASMLGVFIRRETASSGLGVLAAVLLSVHPAIAVSAGPWVFEQNHRLSLMCVLAALWSWQSRRARPAFGAWWPIWILMIIGFLLKEDALMLGPALVAVQILRARFVGDVPRPSRALVAGIAGLALTLLGLRAHWLGGSGGIAFTPDVENLKYLFANVFRAVKHTVWHFHGLFQTWDMTYAVAAIGPMAAMVGGVAVCLWRGRPRALSLLVTGTTLGAACLMPLALYSGETRVHLLALAAVVVMTSGFDALMSIGRHRVTRAITACGLGAVVVLCGFLSHRQTAWYRPCGEGMQASNLIWKEWITDNAWWSTAWTRPWLDFSDAECAAGRHAAIANALDDAWWGLGPPTHDPGESVWYRVIDSDATWLVNRRARALTMSMRMPDATAASPVTVRVAAFRTTQNIVLTSTEWRSVTIDLPANITTLLRAMNRVDLHVSSDAPVPPAIQIREIQLRD